MARQAGKRIAFDPNFRTAMRDASYRPTFEQIAAIASHIKVSDEDLEGPPVPGLRAARCPGRAARAGARRRDPVHTRRRWPVADSAATRASTRRRAAWPWSTPSAAATRRWPDGSAALLLTPRCLPPCQLARIAAVAATAAMHAGPYAPTAQEVDALSAGRVGTLCPRVTSAFAYAWARSAHPTNHPIPTGRGIRAAAGRDPLCLKISGDNMRMPHHRAGAARARVLLSRVRRGRPELPARQRGRQSRRRRPDAASASPAPAPNTGWATNAASMARRCWASAWCRATPASR